LRIADASTVGGEYASRGRDAPRWAETRGPVPVRYLRCCWRAGRGDRYVCGCRVATPGAPDAPRCPCCGVVANSAYSHPRTEKTRTAATNMTTALNIHKSIRTKTSAACLNTSNRSSATSDCSVRIRGSTASSTNPGRRCRRAAATSGCMFNSLSSSRTIEGPPLLTYFGRYP